MSDGKQVGRHPAESALNLRFAGNRRPKGRPGYIRDVVRIRERLTELEGIPGGVTLVAKEFNISLGWLYKHLRSAIL